MSNTFTHYLVPKEDGMLLGLNKFTKINLNEEFIKLKAGKLYTTYSAVGNNVHVNGISIAAYEECADHILKGNV
jgi:hypothetical protein